MAGGGGPSLESTPSWVIGAVVLFMVGISLAIDKLISFTGQKLKTKEKNHLYEALQKIKDGTELGNDKGTIKIFIGRTHYEKLMLLGFVSLLLAVLQDEIASICIPQKFVMKWIPCHAENVQISTLSHRRRRLLAQEDGISSCPKGKAEIVSIEVLHQLHYLIFILAIVHVVCCTVTLLLGEMKISQWRKWEESIRKDNQHDNEDGRIIFTRSLTFIQERYKNVDADKRLYVYSFFKHLAGIVTNADYTAMRTGFILTHCNEDQSFNFHKYMVYAYEEDFRKVVSISWFLWLLVVISFTLNVVGLNIYFWISFVPLILLLVVGAKLEQVITELAIHLSKTHTVIVGSVLIQLSDDHFWFRQPRYILFMIHVILFLNSFGFAIFFWTLVKFGLHSCFMGEARYVYARIFIMLFIQIICSYSTIPLYAIVTQMGSSYNAEAMKRLDSQASNRTDDRIPERTNNTDASVEMANQPRGQQIS